MFGNVSVGNGSEKKIGRKNEGKKRNEKWRRMGPSGIIVNGSSVQRDSLHLHEKRKEERAKRKRKRESGDKTEEKKQRRGKRVKKKRLKKNINQC